MNEKADAHSVPVLLLHDASTAKIRIPVDKTLPFFGSAADEAERYIYRTGIYQGFLGCDWNVSIEDLLAITEFFNDKNAYALLECVYRTFIKREWDDIYSISEIYLPRTGYRIVRDIDGLSAKLRERFQKKKRFIEQSYQKLFGKLPENPENLPLNLEAMICEIDERYVSDMANYALFVALDDSHG